MIKLNIIIKLLKEKNVDLNNYRQEAKTILSIENVSNYSQYIDKTYLNKERIKEISLNWF